MKFEVATELLSNGSSFWAMGETTTHAFALGATISKRPDLQLGGKRGSKRVMGDLTAQEHDTE